jgi:hypothetical protein
LSFVFDGCALESVFPSIFFAKTAALRADQARDILFVRRSFAVLIERLALATTLPARSANLKGLVEAESIVQELEADAASAVLMGWHWCCSDCRCVTPSASKPIACRDAQGVVCAQTICANQPRAKAARLIESRGSVLINLRRRLSPMQRSNGFSSRCNVASN